MQTGEYAYIPAEVKFGLSVAPALAMAFGCKTFVQFESTGVLIKLIAFI